MTDGRRISYDLKYNGNKFTADIDPFVTGLSYTDNFTGSADDLTINLADKDRIWLGNWMPEKGAAIQAVLIIPPGWGNKSTSKRDLGYYEIDESSGGGPPTTVSIKSTSIPQESSLKGEKKSRSWEKTTLKKVLTDVAKKNGLGIYYDAADNPSFERLDQEYESDGAFLYRLCNENGLALKLANKKVYAIDEEQLESLDTVATINRTDQLIKKWNYKDTLNGSYKSCKVTYTDTQKKKTYKQTFTPSKPPKTGRVLLVNEEVNSDAAALRLAKKKLREANKEATTVTITMAGIINLYAGQTVNIKGFSNLDGKYIITSLSGKTGDTSETTLNLRKCLVGY